MKSKDLKQKIFGQLCETNFVSLNSALRIQMSLGFKELCFKQVISHVINCADKKKINTIRQIRIK